MGRTFKDSVRNKDIKLHKAGGRMMTSEMDLHTRVKPLEKRSKGGGKSWDKKFDDWLSEDGFNELLEEEIELLAKHGLTGE
jgi:hypothetical protein